MMEKNVPGLKKMYRHCLAKIRKDKPTKAKADELCKFWSTRYVHLVTSGSNFEPGGVYTNILSAYAMREALKQYIEELD